MASLYWTNPQDSFEISEGCLLGEFLAWVLLLSPYLFDIWSARRFLLILITLLWNWWGLFIGWIPQMNSTVGWIPQMLPYFIKTPSASKFFKVQSLKMYLKSWKHVSNLEKPNELWKHHVYFCNTVSILLADDFSSIGARASAGTVKTMVMPHIVQDWHLNCCIHIYR